MIGELMPLSFARPSALQLGINTTAPRQRHVSASERTSPLANKAVSIRNAYSMSSLAPCGIEFFTKPSQSIEQAGNSSSLPANVDAVFSASRILEKEIDAIVAPIIDAGTTRTIDLAHKFYTYAVDILSNEASLQSSSADDSLKQAKSLISRGAAISRIKDIINDVRHLKIEIDERRRLIDGELARFSSESVRRTNHRLDASSRSLIELNLDGDMFLDKLQEISVDSSNMKDTVAWLFQAAVRTLSTELGRVTDNFGHVAGESTNTQWSQLTSMLGTCRTARDLVLSECGAKWTDDVSRNGYFGLSTWLQELRDKIDGKRSSSPAKSDAPSKTENSEVATKVQLSDADLNDVARGIQAGTSHRIDFFEKIVYVSMLALISALTNQDSKTALAETDKIISATQDFKQFRAELSLDAYVPQIDAYDDADLSSSRYMLWAAQEKIDHVIDSTKNFYDFAQSARNKGGVWNSWTLWGSAIRLQVAKAILKALVLRSEELSRGDDAEKQLADLAENSATGRTIDHDKIASARGTCLASHAWTKQFMVDFYDYKDAIIDSMPDKNKSKLPLQKEFDAIERKIKEASVKRVSLLARLDDAMGAS